MTPALLLDTSVLIHAVRRGAVWDRVQAKYRLFAADPTPRIPAVSVGELRALALRRGWGRRKLDQLAFVLSHFEVMSIDSPGVVAEYAKIDTAAVRGGRALGDNDTWIAATAAALGATLVTTDRDFVWFAPTYLHVDWIDPR